MLHDTELMQRKFILLPQNFNTFVKLLNKYKFIPTSVILSGFFFNFHEHFTGFYNTQHISEDVPQLHLKGVVITYLIYACRLHSPSA